MDPSTWSAYTQHYSRLGSTVTSAASFSQQAQLSEFGLSSTLSRQDHVGGYSAGTTPHPFLLAPHPGLNPPQPPNHVEASFNSANILSSGYEHNLLSAQFQSAAAKGHFTGLPTGTGFLKAAHKEPDLSDLRGGFAHRGMTPNHMGTGANMAASMTGTTAIGSGALFNPHVAAASWRHSNIVSPAGNPFGSFSSEAVMSRSLAVENSTEKLQSHVNKSPRGSIGGQLNDQDLVQTYRNILPSPARPSSSLVNSQNTYSSPLTRQADSYLNSVAELYASKPDFRAYSSSSMIPASHNLVSQPSYSNSTYAPLDLHMEKQNGYDTQSEQKMTDGTTDKESFLPTTSVIVSPQFHHIQTQRQGPVTNGSGSEETNGNGETLMPQNVQSIHSSNSSKHQLGNSPNFNEEHIFNFGNNMQEHSPFASSAPPSSKSHCSSGSATQDYSPQNISQNTSPVMQSTYPPMSTPTQAPTPVHPSPSVSVGQAYIPNSFVSSHEDATAIYSSVITQAGTISSNQTNFSTQSDPSSSPKSHYNGEHTAISQSSVESNHLDMSEQAFFDQLQNQMHSHNVEENCVLDVVSTPLGSDSQNGVGASRNLMEEDHNMVHRNVHTEDQDSPLCSMNSALGMDETRTQSGSIQMNSMLNGPQPLRPHMHQFTSMMSAEERMKVYDFDEALEPVTNQPDNFQVTGFERKPGKRGRPKGRKNFKKRKTKKSPAWELTSEDYMQLKEAQKSWTHTQRSLNGLVTQNGISENPFLQTSDTTVSISQQKRPTDHLPQHHSSSSINNLPLQFGSSYQQSNLDIPVSAFEDNVVHFSKDTFQGISASLNPNTDQRNSFSFSGQGAQSVPMDVTMSTLQREADQEALRVSIDELASALEASEQNNQTSISSGRIDDSLPVLQHGAGHAGISESLFNSNSFDLSSFGKPSISTSCSDAVLHSSSVDIPSFGFQKDAFSIDDRGVGIEMKTSNGFRNDGKKTSAQDSSGLTLPSFRVHSVKKSSDNVDCHDICQDWSLETSELSKSFQKNINHYEASSETRYEPFSVNLTSSLQTSTVDEDKINKSLPSITDDLGFLDFPMKTDKKSDSGKPGAFGGFFKSFLSFLTDKTEDIPGSVSFGKRGIACGRGRGRRARGRGRSLNSSFSSNTAGEQFSVYESGLSVSRKNESSGKDRSLSPVTGNLAGDSSLSFDSSDLQKMVVPNPEAPSFSSDEEDNASQGIASSVAQALRHLSNETESTSHSLKINHYCTSLASGNFVEKTQAASCVQSSMKKQSLGFTERKRGKDLNYLSKHFTVPRGRGPISNTRVVGRKYQFFNSTVRRKRGRPPKPRPMVYGNIPGGEANVPRENQCLHNTEKKPLVQQSLADGPQDEKNSTDPGGPKTTTGKGEDQDDSDSDPIWMPSARYHGRGNRGRGRGRRGMGRRPGRRSVLCKNDIDLDAHDGKHTFSETETKLSEEKVEQQIRHSSRYSRRSKQQEVRECLYRPGDFILSSGYELDKHPPLWRIEGKSLLQRFEAYEADGKVLYRNSSSYTAWNLTERGKYLSATVRVHSNSRDNTVVELLHVQKKEEDKEINGDIVKLTKDENTHPQRENFEVFLQTLISQVLDPNFISEIIKESDEYFLSHVKGIERITSDKKKLLFQQASLEPELLQCAEMYPCVNVMPRKDAELVKCQVCQNVSSDQLVQFYGQVYDQTTLGHRINPDNMKPKVNQFSVCTSCSQKVTLFSRLHHQKYNFFLKCRLKVSAVRGGDDNKESHLILEECLEDNSWVNRMFTEVVEMWNECDWRR